MLNAFASRAFVAARRLASLACNAFPFVVTATLSNGQLRLIPKRPALLDVVMVFTARFQAGLEFALIGYPMGGQAQIIAAIAVEAVSLEPRHGVAGYIAALVGHQLAAEPFARQGGYVRPAAITCFSARSTATRCRLVIGPS